MSNRLAAKRRKTAPGAGPPFVGGLLRLAWQRVRAQVHAAIMAAGFRDLQEAHFPAFSYPLPNGTPPSDFARQSRISRQAAHHLLGQMEALGYFERRAGKASARRLIYLTRRGERVAAAIYASLRALETQWAAEIGPARFEAFIAVLRELAEADEAA